MDSHLRVKARPGHGDHRGGALVWIAVDPPLRLLTPQEAEALCNAWRAKHPDRTYGFCQTRRNIGFWTTPAGRRPLSVEVWERQVTTSVRKVLAAPAPARTPS